MQPALVFVASLKRTNWQNAHFPWDGAHFTLGGAQCTFYVRGCTFCMIWCTCCARGCTPHILHERLYILCERVQILRDRVHIFRERGHILCERLGMPIWLCLIWTCKTETQCKKNNILLNIFDWFLHMEFLYFGVFPDYTFDFWNFAIIFLHF